ncbi:MAG: hypothetical protein L0Z54_02325 [Thermoplasmata archaeon]|nr:hypothetical protein [Thermoplasmata archaeon]
MQCLKGLRRDLEAAIGIGTLIVFIALILVASIAAAVIIQTAYELEQKAELTGSDAARSATGGLAIHTSTGQVTDPGGGRQITALFLIITLNAGSEGMFIGDDGDALIITVQTDSGYTNNATKTVAELYSEDNDVPIISRGDIYEIAIDLGASGVAVNPGEKFTVRMIPQDRVPGTMQSYIAPWDLSDDYLNLI